MEGGRRKSPAVHGAHVERRSTASSPARDEQNRRRNTKHNDSYFINGAWRTGGAGGFKPPTSFHVPIPPVLITLDASAPREAPVPASRGVEQFRVRPIPCQQDQASILHATRVHEVYTDDYCCVAPRSKRTREYVDRFGKR